VQILTVMHLDAMILQCIIAMMFLIEYLHAVLVIFCKFFIEVFRTKFFDLLQVALWPCFMLIFVLYVL